MIALIDYKRRQPDVGARRRSRRSAPTSSRPTRRPSSPSARGDHRAGRRPLRRDARARRRVDRGDPRARRRRPAAARHLPRHAVAVRGQRRSARSAGPRPAVGPVLPAARPTATAPIKVPHVGWNSLDARARRRRSSTASPPGSQVYFTHSYVAPGHRRHRRRHRARRDRSPRSCSAATSPACSSIRRNRATSGCGSCATSSQLVAVGAMLSKRIIACLDVRDGQVVKGINFEGLRIAGDPAELARRYNVEGIDELVILDITATLEARRALADTIRARRARAVHSARGRRRHPHGSRCGGGGRRGRRQGEPEHRGARRPGADHDARRPLRQPGGRRRDRREARVGRQRSVRRLRAQRPDGRRTATPSSGRARPKRAAPARFC